MQARGYVFVIFKVYDLCRQVCDESIGRCHEVALALVYEVKRTKGCKVLAKSFQSWLKSCWPELILGQSFANSGPV